MVEVEIVVDWPFAALSSDEKHKNYENIIKSVRVRINIKSYRQQ